MNGNDSPLLWAHLRAIHSAIAALVIAILALPLFLDGDSIGLYLGIASLVVLAYSFVTLKETELDYRKG